MIGLMDGRMDATTLLELKLKRDETGPGTWELNFVFLRRWSVYTIIIQPLIHSLTSTSISRSITSTISIHHSHIHIYPSTPKPFISLSFPGVSAPPEWSHEWMGVPVPQSKVRSAHVATLPATCHRECMCTRIIQRQGQQQAS